MSVRVISDQYQDLITSFIQDSVDKYIPSKTSRSVSLVPWIIPDIRRKIRRKIKHKIVMHNRATFDQIGRGGNTLQTWENVLVGCAATSICSQS